MKWIHTILTLSLLAIGLPTVSAQTNAALTTLYAFSARVAATNSDGAFPRAGLVLGQDGNFYGTTFQGGAFGYGTVFRMTPSGSLTTLAHFNGPNGRGPAAPLFQDRGGMLYGTTQNGGSNNYGTVFKITTNGTLTSLYSFTFTGGADGAYPISGLADRGDGFLYGTTQDGGTNNRGTIFKITTNGALTRLFSFNNTNGASPRAGLLPFADGNGNFFGTTHSGGAYGAGTVYKFAPQGALIFSAPFGYTNGNQPDGTLLLGRDGNFYGTTRSGGPGNGTNGYGTIFRMSLAGELSTIAVFSNTNGSAPESALIQGKDGNFYGTTAFGSVFKATTNAPPIALVSFVSSNSLYPWGLFPKGSLVEGPDGNFYGVTEQGGSIASQGSIYRINIRPAFVTTVQTNVPGVLTWNGIPGQVYQLQYATSVNSASWINLGTPITATNRTMSAFDPGPLDPQRFYRLVLLP